jgi:hypothetical protein
MHAVAVSARGLGRHARRGSAGALLVIALLAVDGSRMARAQSLSLDPVTARGIAHAGAGLVADDSSAMWWQNPAAAARRGSPRLVLGVASVDTDLAIEPIGRSGAPIAVSRALAEVAPMLAASLSLRGITFGLSFLSAQRLARRLPSPPSDLAAELLDSAYSLRYAGLSGALRRETVSLGAARRLDDQWAIGVSVSGSRVTLRESRRLWAGAEPNGATFDPEDDLEIALSGTDSFSPAASFGMVLAPQESSIEIATAISVVATTQLTGTLSGPTSAADGPGLLRSGGASLRMPATAVLRTGVRWQGQRWSVEGNGALELVPARGRDRRWRLDGVEIVDRTDTITATPTQLPSQLSMRSLAALRGAVDVEAIEGLLWLIGGIGWSPIATASTRVAPGFAELGGHTVSFGAEVSAAGVTVALGLSRTWSRATTVTESLRRLDNPFGTGDAETGFGIYRAAIDLVGISIEVEN